MSTQHPNGGTITIPPELIEVARAQLFERLSARKASRIGDAQRRPRLARCLGAQLEPVGRVA